MTFNPYPKSHSLKKDGKGIRYKLSGQKNSGVTEQYIQRRLAMFRKKWKRVWPKMCDCCGNSLAIDVDHTISKARCKILHKTELIWDRQNTSDSCRTCHNQWESYKSGEFQNHLNVLERMKYVKEHDPEGYELRKNYITNLRILEQI